MHQGTSEVTKKVKAGKVETVDAVMGGDYWLPIVTDPNLDKIQREDLVVGQYVERVREFFDYTYSIPVKELDERGTSVPADELAKYHLIFGTRSPRAVAYMNDVAINALEPYFQQFKDGLLFDMTPGRYEPCPIEELKAAIIAAVDPRPMTRPQILVWGKCAKVYLSRYSDPAIHRCMLRPCWDVDSVSWSRVSFLRGISGNKYIRRG